MSKEKQTQTETQVEDTGLLDNFTWDDENSFFGIPTETPTEVQQQVIKEVTTEEDDEDVDDDVPNDKPKVEKPKTTEVKEEETEMFVEAPETIDNDEADEDAEFYSTLSKELKDKGVFKYATLPEEGQITEEQFFELHEQEVEARADEVINDFVAEINNGDGAAFMKFIRAGGKVSEFFNFYTQNGTVPEADIETESGQDVVLRHYYKTYEGLDDDDIDDKLEWLKDSGKKKKYAEKYNTKMVSEQEAARDQLVKDQELARKKKEQDQKDFVTNLKTTLDTTEGLNGFVFNKKENPVLMDYLVKPQVKLQNNMYLTQFQADLAKIIKEEPQKLLVIAKLMKSNFDTSDIVAKKKTEATQQIRSNLKSTKQLSSTSVTKKRSLSEYFD